MAFARYHNTQIDEYISSEVQERMYQMVMNATPSKLRCIKQAVAMQCDKEIDFINSTLYRIAKKSIEVKERLLLSEQPLMRSAPVGHGHCAVDRVWPYRSGSLWESISSWYIGYQVDKKVVKGLAEMFRGY